MSAPLVNPKQTLSTDLLELPFITDPNAEKSLATRNLLRGQSFGLPSGQAVHQAISAACGEDLPAPDLSGLGLPESLVGCTPLWLYILAEGTLSNGQRLGPVGGRIVAEVLIGLIESDPSRSRQTCADIVDKVAEARPPEKCRRNLFASNEFRESWFHEIQIEETAF